MQRRQEDIYEANRKYFDPTECFAGKYEHKVVKKTTGEILGGVRICTGECAVAFVNFSSVCLRYLVYEKPKMRLHVHACSATSFKFDQCNLPGQIS